MQPDSPQPDPPPTPPGDRSPEMRRGLSRRLWLWPLILVLLGGIGGGIWGGYRSSVLRSIPTQIALAELSLRSGKCDVARSQVSAILYFRPDHPDAVSILGRCLLQEKKPDEAIPILARIPEASPAFEKAGSAWANACLQSGDVEQAETVLRRYLERFPAAETTREELRWLCFNQFRTRDVAQILIDRLRQEPGDPKTLADLIDCEYRQQVPYEGAAYLEQVNRLKPGQGTVSVALGFAKWRMGQIDEARALFRTALVARPEDPHVRFTVTEFLIEQGQLADAEKILDGSPIPGDDRYWSLRSQLAEQKNETATALVHLDKAVELHGNDYRYASRRANLLRKLKRGMEVEAASNTAFQLQRIDRAFADLVEAQTHHHPTKTDALKIADLYQQTGRKLLSENWRTLAEQLPERKP